MHTVVSDVSDVPITDISDWPIVHVYYYYFNIFVQLSRVIHCFNDRVFSIGAYGSVVFG